MARARGEAPAGGGPRPLPADSPPPVPRTLTSARPAWVQDDPAPAPTPARSYLYAALPDGGHRPARPAPGSPAAPPVLRAGRVTGKAALLMGVLLVATLAPTGPGLEPLEHRLPWERAGLATSDLFLEPPASSSLVLASVSTEAPEPTETVTAAALPTGSSYGRQDLPPIPAVVLAAYHSAATELAAADPGCGVTWHVLAGIGAVESRHAAIGGSLGAGWTGIADPPILGPRLDGSAAGTMRIGDTDDGRLDGDPEVDRAVGPMQFLPGTWTAYGTGDPQDVRAASVAAGRYLCAGQSDLRDPLQLATAIFRYNRSDTYVRKVLALSSAYLGASLGTGPEAVAATAIAFAYARLGDPYLWGGTGPLYDCSGLTQAAFRSAGVGLPRTAAEQWVGLPRAGADDLRPGDLVFFQLGARIENMPGHVGIYLGAGRMVEAPYTGSTVRIGTLAHAGPLVGVRRPTALADPDASLSGGSFLAPELASDPTATPSPSPSPSASPVAAPSPSLVPPVVAVPLPSPEPAAPSPSGPVPSASPTGIEPDEVTQELPEQLAVEPSESSGPPT